MYISTWPRHFGSSPSLVSTFLGLFKYKAAQNPCTKPPFHGLDPTHGLAKCFELIARLKSLGPSVSQWRDHPGVLQNRKRFNNVHRLELVRHQTAFRSFMIPIFPFWHSQSLCSFGAIPFP